MPQLQLASRACTVSLLMLMGCQSKVVPMLPTVFAVDETPQWLLEPGVQDWTTQHVSNPRIAAARKAYAERLRAEAAAQSADAGQRKVQLFNAAAVWQSGGADGIPLTTLDGSAGLANDYMPNGPASVYFTSGSPTVVKDCIFFLSQKGKLSRVKKDRSAVSTLDLGSVTVGGASGHTFSRTFVTISPAGGRVYMLSDGGVFFVVNTATTPMTWQGFNLGVGNNKGLAPVFDPMTASHSDGGEDVYVPLSNGRVYTYSVKRVGATNPPTVTAGAVHNAGGTFWGALKAPPRVFAERMFVGDQSGNLVHYNIVSSSVVSTATLGYPVNASPSFLLDGANRVTDAFVNVGARCAWVTFDAAGAVTASNLSRSLWLDESTTYTARQSGTLSQWTYVDAPQKYWLPVQEVVTLNTDNTQRNLGDLGDYRTNSVIACAETQVHCGPPKTDGPAVGYARWDLSSGTVLPDTAKLSSDGEGIKIWMTPTAATIGSRVSTPPQFRSTSHKHTGNKVWTFGTGTSTDMDNTNEPALGAAGYTSIVQPSELTDGWKFNNRGREAWAAKYYAWRVAAGQTPASMPTDYAVALMDEVDAATDNLLWPSSCVTDGNGNNPIPVNKTAPQFVFDFGAHGVPGGFKTASTVGRPGPGVTGTYLDGTTSADVFNGLETALLEVKASGKSLPSISLETPPVLDLVNGKKVYVISTNTVFCLDFSSVANWTDTTGTVTKFALSRHGDRSNGAAGSFGPSWPPSGAAAANRFVNAIEHRTAPQMNWEGTAIYMLDRYPVGTTTAPTDYTYGVTKVALGAGGFNAAGGQLYATANGGNAEAFRPGGADSAAARDVSAYLMIDYFTGSKNVYFGLPATGTNTGYVYQIAP